MPYYDVVDDYTLEDIKSYHTKRLRRLHVTDMDPSMLIAFLIRDEADWRNWRLAISESQGKSVVRVTDTEPTYHGKGAERAGAVDEVDTFDDENDDNRGLDESNGELINHKDL